MKVSCVVGRKDQSLFLLLCAGAGPAVEDSLAELLTLGLEFQCYWRGTLNLIFNSKLKEFRRAPSLLLWKMGFAF